MHEAVHRDDRVVRVAHIARDLAHLPGAATPDWCQRAAEVLTRHDPSTRAWVAAVAPGGSPSDRRAEAAGYAEGADLARDPTPERLALAMARAVFDTLDDLDRPDVVSVGQLLRLVHRPPRGVTILRAHQHIIVGVAEVEPPTDLTPHPRLLLICWDRPTDPPEPDAPDDLRPVLESVLPVARDRLRQALGNGECDNPWLSRCEQRVLDMLTRGMSVPEIAQALGRSPHTIHDQVKRLHAKLGARTRGALLSRVLGHHPLPDLPVRVVRNRPPTLAFRTSAYVDHRGW